MSKILVLGCVCQECNMEFAVNDQLTNVVNMDYDTKEKSDFENMTLNRVSCPHCGKSFTFEIPMVFVSNKLGYAIKVNPESFLTDENDFYAPNFLLPDSFMLREVYFQIEALEKHRIFTSGCDDRIIEYVKASNFSDGDTLPFDEFNMIFDKFENGIYYFSKYNSTNDCIENYSIDSKHINLPDFTPSRFEGKWQMINRLTINNYIEKENGL